MAAVPAGSRGVNGLQELKVDDRNGDDEEETVHSLTGENAEPCVSSC